MPNEVSRSNYQETSRQRARPVKGGKTTCCRCDKPHAPGSGYCDEHRAEYMRGWRKAQRDELLALRKMVGTWVDPA
jgi:hypothetical protein